MTTDIDTRIDNWKEQLLDLTRRNDMVDFSATKTKSLPTENTDWLALAGELEADNTVYIYRPDPDVYEAAQSVAADDSADTSDKDESESDLQEIAREVTNDEPGTDTSDAETKAPAVEPDLEGESDRPTNELISIRSPEETDNSLYNISLNQRKYLQEKGVDSLYLTLGMLEWYSVDYSEEGLRSPLFMVSVSLERTTISDPEHHDYELTYDEEVLINPALRKMLRSDFDLELPPDEDVDITNLKEVTASIEEIIKGHSRWEITDEVILGIFDFSKLSLYNDLEENRAVIRSNAIIKALNDDTSEVNADASGVPDPEDLDDVVDPSESFQVLEADSSQQHAIEAAKSGVSFVMQGPPGTGKSQTIANIIAEKLAAGEQVLFVSEKQAALDVVRNRLGDAGLARFCLAIHGKNASKDKVLSSLETELNADPIAEPSNRDQYLGKLRKRRAQLNEYGELLQTEFGEIETTAYDAHGIVSNLEAVETPTWTVDDPLSVSQAEFTAAVDGLETLTQYDEELSAGDEHPWQATTLRQWQIDTSDRMEESLKAQQEVLDEVMDLAADLAAETGLHLETVAQFEDCLELIDLLETRPDVDWREEFFTDVFLQEGDRLASFAEASKELKTAQQHLDEHYTETIYQETGATLNAELSSFGLLRFVQPSYYQFKRRVLSHAEEGYSPGYGALQEDLTALMTAQQMEETIEEFTDVGEQLGPLYEGVDTDWETLLAVKEWLEEVAASDAVDLETLRHQLLDGSIEIATYRDDAAALLERWERATEFFRGSMAVDAVRTPDGTPLYEAPLEEATASLASLENQLHRLQGWVQFAAQREDAEDAWYGDFVAAALAEDIGPEDLVDSFRKAFYTQFLNTLYEETALGEFQSQEIERAMQEFRRLDKKQQELAKVEIQHRVTRQRPQMDLEHASSSQQVVLRREIEKQRRRMPLRKLFTDAGEMITRLKPCFMMSPLAVAQHLQTGGIDFDCVIFDEASQIMPQDAISSLIRAEQAVIAGDTKQLPPTSFFRADVDSREDVREDLESILDEAAAVLPEMYLRWHYRSRTDELIEFSNQKYYDGRLNTFPENHPELETGVAFDYVEDGVYDRGGSRKNMPEAEHVVDRVQEFAAEYPEKSLGVVAFSQAQEQAIRDVIEERRQEDRTLDAFVDETDALEGFFVKNLESVQGDERDVMMFSIGYGPDRAGKISMNFGPLNKDGGERRLNVAVTRARERNIVISSLQPGDIDLSNTSARGVRDFKTYLQYAKKGEQALVRDDNTTETLQFDSAFEEAVYTALEDAGYDVASQIQSAGYSIDLAIKHPDQPGEYVLGIECDGAAYHSSNTARDRDRTRQIILEDLGWTIHRIWSPDWASNQDRELRKIRETVEQLLDDRQDDPTSAVDVEVEDEQPEAMSKAEMDGGVTQFENYVKPDQKHLHDRDFDSIPDRKLGGELVRITEEYGPIEKNDAFTLLVKQWQFSRVGKKMRRKLKRIARRLDGEKLIRHDGFLWPADIQKVPVRVNSDSASRSADEVPKEELAKAAHTILEQGLAMSREDLVLETARKFGWARRGETIKSRLNDAIDLLIAVGGAEEDGMVRPNSIDIDQKLLGRLD